MNADVLLKELDRMISATLKGTGGKESEELRKDPSLPIRLWKAVLNRVSYACTPIICF